VYSSHAGVVLGVPITTDLPELFLIVCFLEYLFPFLQTVQAVIQPLFPLLPYKKRYTQFYVSFFSNIPTKTIS
jgi:hypothetical protein